MLLAVCCDQHGLAQLSKTTTNFSSLSISIFVFFSYAYSQFIFILLTRLPFLSVFLIISLFRDILRGGHTPERTMHIGAQTLKPHLFSSRVGVGVDTLTMVNERIRNHLQLFAFRVGARILSALCRYLVQVVLQAA